MVEQQAPRGGEAAGPSSSLVTAAGRQRFMVELRPGETTIVSWKKMVKDAGKADQLTAIPSPASISRPVFEPRLAPGQPAENEAKDAPPGSRFSAVIEKIERLYMGKHSSDEEDLNDVPVDDEYDTEDSFIDDMELDEYFQVDNSAIKHDGFFVNKGKLERINEPTLLPNQQQKKRGRKDLDKGHGEGGDGHVPNKHVRVGRKVAGKSVHLVRKNSTDPSQVVELPNLNHEHVKFQNQMKKSAETKFSSDPVLSSWIDERGIDKQKTGLAPTKCQGSIMKDRVGSSGISVQRSHDKSSYAQCMPQSGINNIEQLGQPVQRSEKDGIHERPDPNVSEGKYSMQTVIKEGSSARAKSTMLEKAIRELERMVAELRPSTIEAQDADNSSQAVKRRLPREVKQKLAKVARVAQASQGKISKELVNHLMSILGHLIQLRTLKRNLKDMVNMGLSAKKEKDDRLQQMKKEVADLIRMQLSCIKSKALEQQAGAFSYVKEIGNEGEEINKRKYAMDDVLEDKIRDLYDLYVEGLDEDTGPQVRKLYAELAGFWPDGLMDNQGIKRAIRRAIERKKSLYSQHKDAEKIRRKKSIPSNEAAQFETSSVVQPQHVLQRLVGNHGLTPTSRPPGAAAAAAAASTTVWMPDTINDPNIYQPKQEKVAGSSTNPSDSRRKDAMPQKKVKRKPKFESGEAHRRPEKLTYVQGESRLKSHKQVAAPQKPSLPSACAPPRPSQHSATGAPNFEQPS
ncbi:ubinuclein-1-like isoform X2 [Diospyros lotus]|uniref:ubinuclein-1-like isoform X2 n=1 Tax=Diospyros lotus TaxID=55363 RepID=UPI00224E3431|nr:ubinuclein-1-like isoform X2 [Diospyros lotus]